MVWAVVLLLCGVEAVAEALEDGDVEEPYGLVEEALLDSDGCVVEVDGVAVEEALDWVDVWPVVDCAVALSWAAVPVPVRVLPGSVLPIAVLLLVLGDVLLALGDVLLLLGGVVWVSVAVDELVVELVVGGVDVLELVVG